MQTGSCLRKPKKRPVIRKPLHHYQNPQIGLILSRVPRINLPRCFFSGLATVLALGQQNADAYWDICHRTPSQCVWHFASSSSCMYSISFSYLVLLPVYEIHMVVLSCLWCFYQEKKIISSGYCLLCSCNKINLNIYLKKVFLRPSIVNPIKINYEQFSNAEVTWNLKSIKRFS